jgi:hypothetical protein
VLNLKSRKMAARLAMRHDVASGHQVFLKIGSHHEAFIYRID